MLGSHVLENIYCIHTINELLMMLLITFHSDFIHHNLLLCTFKILTLVWDIKDVSKSELDVN